MRKIKIILFIVSIIFCYSFTEGRAEEQKRAMTFLDIIQMPYAREPNISPDGKWFIYALYVPDWEKNETFSDIYITKIGDKTKQMTFTKDKNENSPKWYKDSSIFAFLSNRSEDKTQIFFMRPDGGEAWQVTDDKYGVSSYEWSKDGKYLAYLGGKSDERQIWIMPGKGSYAEKLTNHKTPIISYLWSPDGKKIYFVAPDSVDSLNKERKEKGFDVEIKDEIRFPSHLWEIDIETKEERRLTVGNEYSVSEISISDDGTKIAFNGAPTKRYRTYIDIDVYLINLDTNTISRITNNSVDEWYLSFSPDSKWLAFTIPDGEKEFMNLRKIYVIPSKGDKANKLLNNFNYEPWISFWSDDSRYIYFTAQVGVDYHLFRVSIDNDHIEQITKLGGFWYSSFIKDEDSGKFIIGYTDPENPSDYYYSEPENFADRDKWIRLTDSNPQVKCFLLGKQETIRWKSTDGTIVEGILIKPVNYRENRKYPLIVQIHGGPADAYINDFSAYIHIFAANDYVVFQPNYRGSSGYGEKFKKGDFLRQGFDDIMTGVDYLIERDIVHPDSMGIMGWSAGGDLSNWALVYTNRFKAISTGAGVVNWISFYGQTDIQYWTELYFKGTPYNNWDNYVDLSPLKYIKNATTPTLIHFGENDRTVPRPQGEELHMAIKKLGVPTEFIIYPNTGHGIRDMRYQMVKRQAEFNWFEKWIRGKEGWIDWKMMIETLEKEEK